jgi:hypothetical protein
MMTSTNDIFSEFEGIRRRMERTWRRAREEPSRLAVLGVAAGKKPDAKAKTAARPTAVEAPTEGRTGAKETDSSEVKSRQPMPRPQRKP